MSELSTVFLFRRHNLWRLIEVADPTFYSKQENKVKLETDMTSERSKSFLSSSNFNKKPGSNFRPGFLKFYPAGAVQAILPFPFVKGG